jgi:hypothetical protein
MGVPDSKSQLCELIAVRRVSERLYINININVNCMLSDVLSISGSAKSNV